MNQLLKQQQTHLIVIQLQYIVLKACTQPLLFKSLQRWVSLKILAFYYVVSIINIVDIIDLFGVTYSFGQYKSEIIQ